MKLSEHSIDKILQVIPATGLMFLFATPLLPGEFFSDIPNLHWTSSSNNLVFSLGADSGPSRSQIGTPTVADSAIVEPPSDIRKRGPVDPLKPRLIVLLEASAPNDSQGEVEILDLLENRDQCKTIYGDHNVTPLMLAAGNSSLIVLLKLMECGGEINRTNTFGSTALMYAASAGRTENVKALLGKGADRTVIDSSGDTALTMATQQLHTDIVEMLRKK